MRRSALVIFAALMFAAVFATAARADEKDDWRAFRAVQVAQLKAQRNEFSKNAVGDISALGIDEHWTKADSPKRITSNYSVPAGKTLTIESGVEVIVENGSRFDIYGTVLISGSAQEPVVFRFSGTPPKSENRPDLARSVNFYDLSSRGDIRYTKFYNGSKISMFSNESFVLEHSEFHDFTEYDLTIFQELEGQIGRLRLNDNLIKHNNVPEQISGLQIFSENLGDAEVMRNRLVWQGDLLKSHGGIHFWQSGKNIVIADNIIETNSSKGDDWRGNIFGISLWDKLENSTVTRNTLTGTGKTQRTNIILWDEADRSTRIEQNTVTGAKIGLELWDTGRQTFERNLFKANDIGVQIHKAGQKFLRNKIIKNRIGIGTIFTTASFALEGRGNTISASGDYGVFNGSDNNTLMVNDNWWGDKSGPSGDGYQGKGDKVSAGVKVDNWLSRAPLPIVLAPGLGASFHTGLLANPNDQKGELTGWRFMPGVNYYDGLIKAMETVGYKQGVDLFTAYYDWRLPAADAARLYLKPTIDKARVVSGDDKVDIIGHSLGGIVSRAYVQGSGYDGDVNALIMLGAPNQGSAKAYPVWGGGILPPDWWMIRPYIWYLKKINSPVFPWLLDDFYIIRTFMRSVKDLLPIYDFLIDSQSKLVKKQADMIERNLFVTKLNSDKEIKSELFSILGTGKKTRSLLEFEMPGKTKWVDGKPIRKQTDDTLRDGDGTIPTFAATFGKETKVYEINSSHEKLPSKAIPTIFDILEMLHPQGNFDIYIPSGVMTFAFASPVKAVVVGPDGKKYDQEEVGELKIITIPDPPNGKYTIELTGTGDGEYHTLVAFDDAANEQSLVSELDPQTIKKDRVVNYVVDLDSQRENLTVTNTTPLETPPPPTSPSSPTLPQPSPNPVTPSPVVQVPPAAQPTDTIPDQKQEQDAPLRPKAEVATLITSEPFESLVDAAQAQPIESQVAGASAEKQEVAEGETIGLLPFYFVTTIIGGLIVGIFLRRREGL